MIGFNMFMVVVLLVLTAFFVASEFAIVKVRKSQLNMLLEEGHPKAKMALHVVDHLDDYLSACQLGITVTALGLGWLGEPTFHHLLYPLFHMAEIPETVAHTISFLIAFLFVTFLHVVLGELAPKTVAIQRAEAITLRFARPLIWFHRIMFPFIWLLNGSGNLVVRMFGFKSANEQEEAHSEEELRHILSESFQKGEINRSEYEYVDRIFKFDNRTAKEIMIPRTDMAVVDIEDSLQSIIAQMKSERYTRYPVVQGDRDHVIGMIHIKEIFIDGMKIESIKPFIRPVMKVFENIPIHELLVKLQRERTQLAILMDEYGGTSGLVTLEDILEEIVGEIRDEFDHEEQLPYKKVNEEHYVVDGKMSIQDLNELIDIELDNHEIDTISGWIYTQDIDAKEGTTVHYGDFRFTVVNKEGGQIKQIEVRRDD
ncbi:hemolysin family protein [Salirhabdus salicampi]|uniref:hemolysin family protein n=1 Tax=Salirhabdus salicampi TaxID=476102 RepID=UPI0020C3B0B4|nr:hemolysin family protein [Salirhabdus salicampi]MCP8616037.1 hemolysin family protein [Salirhabdus salicampi]